MKPYSKLIAVVLVAGVVLPLMIKGPDGEPVMQWRDWLPEPSARQSELLAPVQAAAQKMAEQLPVELPAVGPPTSLSSSSGKMYKWQDEKGRWHFSSEKPSAQEATLEDLPTLDNVMVPTMVPGTSDTAVGAGGAFPEAGALPLGPLSISMEQAGKLLKQVEDISKQSAERNKALDEL